MASELNSTLLEEPFKFLNVFLGESTIKQCLLHGLLYSIAL